MQIVVTDAKPGQVAASPGGVLRALVDIATADGADPDDWMAKAAQAAGATRVGIRAGGEPRYQVVHDAVERGGQVFESVVASMLSQVEATIQEHIDQKE